MNRHGRFFKLSLTLTILLGIFVVGQTYLTLLGIVDSKILGSNNIIEDFDRGLFMKNLGGNNALPAAFGHFVDEDSSYEFAITFGGEEDDQANYVQRTSDGGFIIIGSTLIASEAANDVYLIKTDSLGNRIWEKRFGGPSIDVGNAVEETSDGGFILIGLTSSFGAGSGDFYLVKTDSDGNMLWNKTFGGENLDVGHSVHQTSDGGYFLVGITSSFGGGNNDVYVVKTDPSGTLIWNKTYGGVEGDWALSSDTTSDGGFILVGGTYRGPENRDDVLLIKIDSQGKKMWEETYGGNVDEHGNFVQQTSDGGYIIIGQAATQGLSGEDVYLIKTDSVGNLIWEKLFGEEAQDIGYSGLETEDGGYVVAGFTASYGEGRKDGYIIRTDSSGNKIWDRTIGDIYDEWLDSIKQTEDGGYIVAGMTNSEGSGKMDVLLAKIESTSKTNATTTSTTTITDDDGESTDIQFMLFIFGLAGLAIVMAIIILKFGLVRGGETKDSEEKPPIDSTAE